MRVGKGPGENGSARLVAQQPQTSCASGTNQKVQTREKMEKPVGDCECLAEGNGGELAENPPLPNIDQSKLQAEFL